MEFGVLGPLRVLDDDGRPLDVTSPAQRLLLASLIARAGEVVPVDTLADALWGDGPPTSAVNSLRSQVSRLRRVIGDRIAGGPDGYVLALDPSVDAVDAVRFDRALEAVRTRAEPVTLALLAAEAGSWRGRAYGELADVATVRAEARRLDLARIDAAELLAGAALERGRWSDAAAAAESIVAADELREPAWEVLVRSLSRAGRKAEALRAARRAADALGEAGLLPGAGLRAAEAEALAATPEPETVGRRVSRPPAPLTPTVGRSTELATVLDTIERARLVTIVGPGGVGKTRLAVEAARVRASSHRRGALVVELARVTDAAGVDATVAGALDRRGELTELDDSGGLDVLVVLDNCEHVIDAVGALVPRLLAGGDDLRILATSREAVAVEGEHVVPVGPLATAGVDAPAVELFRQRALAAGVTGPLDAALVGGVVNRLDGLPLAVEMAAARLRTMSLGELAASIDSDPDVLASPRRDVADRHRTLRDLLAWSERLLDDELREALLGFAVFAGPVRVRDLPAAIRGDRPADTIARLVDRSLVMVVPGAGAVCFSALETVRSYGRERLRVDGTYQEARRRHAEWFVAAVAEIDEQLRTVDEAAALRRFADIFDEVRAAVRWSLDHDLEAAAGLVERSYLAARMLLRSEVVFWTADVVDRLPVGHASRARVVAALAGGLSMLGRLDEAIRTAERALELATDPHDAVYAFEAMGDAATYQGRLDDAVRICQRAVAVATAAGDAYYTDLGRVGTALAHAYAGRSAEALAALGDVPISAMPSMAGWYEYTRGEVILDDDPAVALVHLDAALEIAQSNGDRYLTEVAMLSASSLRARTGDVEEAAARFVDLLDHFRLGGDPGHLVTSLRNLVTLLVRLGDHRAAAALYGAVVDHPSSPTYGAEAARLSAAAAEAATVMGEKEFARVVALGRRRSIDEAATAAAHALR